MKSNNFKYSDMHIKIPSTKNGFSFGIFALVSLLLTSCITVQPVADRDGIYSNGTTQVVVEEENPDAKNNYYKQYFNTKSQQLEDIPQDEDLIFTDIESYTTTESVDDQGNIVIEEPVYEEGYGSWGSNEGDVTINVINNGGLYGAGWYGAGWGLGWNRPWGLGLWGRPYWGWGGFYGGWGLGWGGFYNAWYCPPLYGGYYAGYNHPYYGGYYGNSRYGYAYNRGRSNNSYRGRANYNNRRSNIANRGRGNYSRTEANRRSSRSSVNRTNRSSRTRVDRGTRSTTRTTRPNTRTTRPNTRTTRPSSRTRTTRPNTRTTRPNTRSTRSSSSSRGGSYNRGGGSRSSGSRGGGSRGRGRG